MTRPTCFICGNRPGYFCDPATGEFFCGYHRPKPPKPADVAPWIALHEHMRSCYGDEVAAERLGPNPPEDVARDKWLWSRIGQGFHR